MTTFDAALRSSYLTYLSHVIAPTRKQTNNGTSTASKSSRLPAASPSSNRVIPYTTQCYRLVI